MQTPRFVLKVSIIALLLLSGCASSGVSSGPSSTASGASGQKQAATVDADDPFAEDYAFDYLTQEAAEGLAVVGDDYFDDDDYLDDYSLQVIIPDPLEPWNRFWFGFNDVFLEYVARPVSKGYEFVVPSPARRGIKNFFYNLRGPSRMVNNLLQGKPMAAGVEFSRFFLNTIAGFGGLMDIASQYEPVVMVYDEDFGQTLGVWGMGEGVYLVWPLLGPSNVRDTFGLAGGYVIDYYTNPLLQFTDQDWTAEIAITALNTLNDLGNILKSYDTFKEIAIDPYTAMRDGWTQLRRSAISK